MPVPLYLVDAFTDRPFAGNPAGVCLLGGWPEDRWMQNVAMEMRQAETAFVWKRPDGAFPLRWFTPAAEVALCGHATLATAHVVWSTGLAPPSEALRFDTRSGILTAALGVTKPRHVGRNQFDYLVELDSEAAVRAVVPDFPGLSKVSCRGVIVTAPSADPRFDFVSRFFAPAVGVDEDPVTGSAHCCLADYWGTKLGKTELVGYQASARGGVVRVARAGDRVKLAGRALTVVEGVLLATGV